MTLWDTLQQEVHWAVRLLIPAAFVVGGYLFIHYTGQIQDLFSKGTQVAIDGGKTEAKTHGAFVARQQHLQQLADRRLAWARQATDSAHRMTLAFLATRDTGQALFAHALTADQMRAAAVVMARAGQECADALLVCKARGDTLQLTAATEKARADLAEARAAHADSIVAPLLKVADCHWLHLGFLPKCLSRVQSVEVGIALTVAAGVAFHIHF